MCTTVRAILTGGPLDGTATILDAHPRPRLTMDYSLTGDPAVHRYGYDGTRPDGRLVYAFMRSM